MSTTGAGISSVFRTDDMAGDGDVIIVVELAAAAVAVAGGLTTTGDGDLTLLLLLVDIFLGDADMIVGEGDLTVADVVDPPPGLSLKIFASRGEGLLAAIIGGLLLEDMEEVKAVVAAAVAASGLSIEEAAVTEEEAIMGALSNPANGSSVPV